MYALICFGIIVITALIAWPVSILLGAWIWIVWLAFNFFPIVFGILMWSDR